MNEIATISEEAEELDQTQSVITKDFEVEKQRVLSAISGNSPKRLVDRVAWILNHYTNARDSDIACQLHYWRTFQGDLYSGGNILQENYPKLERLNNVTRARARVQNDLKMFIASPEVRKRRGKLEEEEKQRALDERPTFPIYCIYADESGKTSKYLLVGSVWVLRSYETIKITNAIIQKKQSMGFRGEMHFKDINKGNLGVYLELLNAIIENSSSISFKGIGVLRSGLTNLDDTLNKLFYHMVIQGIKEEDRSGRAVLPRNLQFRKDSEEESKDRLSMMEIELQLKNAAKSIFNDRLYVDVVEAENSERSPLMQIADLFVSSISRHLNKGEGAEGPKDIFAKKFLQSFGVNTDSQELDGFSDCVRFSQPKDQR
ncbi:DUF3800 domain-containing protein [Pseudomonas sp. W15Feb9B]|uniref:DUF3800 domain-containing protein n=1 Tax=Pseudomonas sp. W15Feb9B TaxID=550743 RepID=UPI000596FB80|nr:DUF3800 domain-containing protein [Pseudomonas sp. W15Feb9B]KIK90028.1 hypothetical protein OC71_00130 [Pseudomonas sp. W15Feb9B]